jgi:ribosomal protein L17
MHHSPLHQVLFRIKAGIQSSKTPIVLHVHQMSTTCAKARNKRRSVQELNEENIKGQMQERNLAMQGAQSPEDNSERPDFSSNRIG